VHKADVLREVARVARRLRRHALGGAERDPGIERRLEVVRLPLHRAHGRACLAHDDAERLVRVPVGVPIAAAVELVVAEHRHPRHVRQHVLERVEVAVAAPPVGVLHVVRVVAEVHEEVDVVARHVLLEPAHVVVAVEAHVPEHGVLRGARRVE
jgi:hypothetical protein